MLFTTYQYWAFFAAVLVLFYLLPRWGARKWLLLIASYGFYLSWNWRFLPLLAGLTVIDYAAAHWIERSTGSRKRLSLLVSLGANLGLLGFFKYYNFFVSAWPQYRLDIILPLGISFHTFQSISYVVDVYRGQQRAVRNFLDYALFISFFPQLVAGPIVRAGEFFRDLYAWVTPNAAQIRSGLFLILCGLVKKAALADSFAQHVDAYFDATPHPIGAGPAWGAMVAFALQIFFDFSGYTDIAIGCARLLGFEFPENFRRPYLSRSITEFWRRWHLSLSSWLRDYLYIPLGGNRGGALKTYRNLLLTMLLGGLWHGASWNFVIWGGFHGLLLAIERALGVRGDTDRRWTLLDVPRVLITFVLVTTGWVFFRAKDLPDSMAVLQQMYTVPKGAHSIEPALLWLTAFGLLLAVWDERRKAPGNTHDVPRWALLATFAVGLLVVEVFSPEASLPFVYFQF